MPTTWITITVADLDTAKAAALVDALRTAALRATPPQADPMPAIIASVTTRIRAEIAAGGKTVLDVGATKLPPSLKSLALRMVLREGQSRLNAAGALPLSDDERDEKKDDLRYLERIARGEISVEASDNPEATPSVQATVPSPQIAARERTMSRDNLDGS